ncbi:MAG: KOW motif-containing protein [Chloroflexi bacterium]|nr:KOW motif-containing protein [Chloroflexota bacterium]
MLRWLLRRGPGVGDDVTVLVGPFAGHSGRITERDADGRFLVVIDECCRPLVAAADLRIAKSAGVAERLDAVHHEVEQDPDATIARQQAATAQQNGIGLGPPSF